MSEVNRQLVRDFFDAVVAGDLPDELLTEDMRAWTTTQGDMPKAQYQGLIRMLANIVREPLDFTIDSIICEDDRAVAELHSTGTLADGTAYANDYAFGFRFRNGKIASVAEHFNASVVQETMVPLVMKMRKQ